MGLDMYLFKRIYVKQYDVTVTKGGEMLESLKPDRISYVTEEVAYWRKFNALHSWFVDNCQDGVDDCRETYVPREKIEVLINVLKEVKEVLDNSKTETVDNEKFYVDTDDRLENLFPTRSGFFFGSTNYDEYYYSEVSKTLELLQELLAEPSDLYDFYYCSSW